MDTKMITPSTPLADVAKWIGKCTDQNWHGEAIEALARFSGNSQAIHHAVAANLAHNEIGHLSGPLRTFRESIRGMATLEVIHRHGMDVLETLEKEF